MNIRVGIIILFIKTFNNVKGIMEMLWYVKVKKNTNIHYPMAIKLISAIIRWICETPYLIISLQYNGFLFKQTTQSCLFRDKNKNGKLLCQNICPGEEYSGSGPSTAFEVKGKRHVTTKSRAHRRSPGSTNQPWECGCCYRNP